MGFFSGLGNLFRNYDPSRFAQAQAFMSGDYGAAGNIIQNRQRLRADRQQAEAQARALEQQRQAALALGLSPDMVNAMNPEDLSRVVSGRIDQRQFGPEGGSYLDPVLNKWVNAPRNFSDQGRVYNINPDGTPRQVLDSRKDDIEWQTGPWGAFATDRNGRPVAPGTNIQSQMGQQPGQPQLPMPGQGPAQPQPGIFPTSSIDADGVFGRMIQRESRGQQFDRNGRPLRSNKGAIGIAQVMPGTGPEAAALAGLPWDPRRLREDPQYNAALGRAYYERQLQTFGDPVLAAAAYNAGPQRIRNALRRGGANWQAHIPQETRDYVRAVFGDNASGTQMAQGGAPNIPGQGRSIQEQAAGGFVQAPQAAPPGMRWTPQGGLEPIQGSEQEYGRQHQNQQAIGTVIQQYRSDPIVREWQQARTATGQVQTLGQSGTPADDIAIIFTFMKSLDPTSAVREAEQATAQNAAGIPDRIRNYYNQLLTGQRLTPNQRADLIQTSGRMYRERSRTYNEHIRSYHRQLQDLGVENPAEFAPLAMSPITHDRRQREAREAVQNPDNVLGPVQDAIDQMIPGSPSRVRITRRRRR